MTLFTQDNAFDFAGSEYAKLFAASDASAFQSPLWLDHFYRLLAPHRQADKVVVTLRDEEGALLAVVPLIRRRKSGLVLVEATDLGVSDYAAPVLSPAALEVLRGEAGNYSPPYEIYKSLIKNDYFRRVRNRPSNFSFEYIFNWPVLQTNLHILRLHTHPAPYLGGE